MPRLQRVIMISSVLLKKNKEKRIVRSQLSQFSISLCRSFSISLTFSLTPSPFFFTPSSAHVHCAKVSPQQINRLVTCHFKGWCLICVAFTRAEGDFLLRHHAVILCPAHPGSEHTLDPLFCVVGSMFVSFCPSPSSHTSPLLFLFIKVVIIFQPAFTGMFGVAGV